MRYVAVVFLICGAAAAQTPTSGSGKPGPLAPVVEPLLEARKRMIADLPFHGIAIQIHTADQALERYTKLIDEIAALGADTVLISVNGYQEDVDAVLIEVDAQVTPTDEVLCQLFDHAHKSGLRVILMPKILLTDPRGGAWRGKIKPPTWDGWFNQYRQFILHYAKLAQRCNVEVFMVGSELISTEKLTDYWIESIRQVREVYHGWLAYSANWDHYTAVHFWDHLDLIGMTSYYKLADEPAPSAAELRKAWKPIKEKVLEFQKRIGKPILFAEVGWCSQEGCSVEAWNYYRQDKSTPAGIEEQRLNYQVFMEVWEKTPDVGGMIWWEWTEGEAGAKDFSYSPKNKPAEKLLRDLFKRRAQPRNDENGRVAE